MRVISEALGFFDVVVIQGMIAARRESSKPLDQKSFQDISGELLGNILSAFQRCPMVSQTNASNSGENVAGMFTTAITLPVTRLKRLRKGCPQIRFEKNESEARRFFRHFRSGRLSSS